MFDEMQKVISSKKIFQIPKVVIIVFILLTIGLFCICKIRISLYDSYQASVVEIEGEYYVKIYMDYDKSSFLNNDEVLINNKSYSFNIYKIDNQLINNNIYFDVYLKMDLENDYKIHNYPIVIKQKQVNQTIFKIIYKKIKEELGL